MSVESFNNAIQSTREAFYEEDAVKFELSIHRAQATLCQYPALTAQLASAKQQFPSVEALHIIAHVTLVVSEFRAGMCFATR